MVVIRLTKIDLFAGLMLALCSASGCGSDKKSADAGTVAAQADPGKLLYAVPQFRFPEWEQLSETASKGIETGNPFVTQEQSDAYFKTFGGKSADFGEYISANQEADIQATIDDGSSNFLLLMGQEGDDSTSSLKYQVSSQLSATGTASRPVALAQILQQAAKIALPRIDDIAELRFFITGVRIQRYSASGYTWLELPVSASDEGLNVVALRNGKTATLAASALPSGKYGNIEVSFRQETQLVLRTGRVNVPAVQSTAMIVGGFTHDEELPSVLIADIVASQSLTLKNTGGSNEHLAFQPQMYVRSFAGYQDDKWTLFFHEKRAPANLNRLQQHQEEEWYKTPWYDAPVKDPRELKGPCLLGEILFDGKKPRYRVPQGPGCPPPPHL